MEFSDRGSNQKRAFEIPTRLTEEEWYAEASNGGKRKYPWGDAEVTCDYAVWGDGKRTDGCGSDSTWPVCSKERVNSVSGICDMSGFVAWRQVFDSGWAEVGVRAFNLLNARFRDLVAVTRPDGVELGGQMIGRRIFLFLRASI